MDAVRLLTRGSGFKVPEFNANQRSTVQTTSSTSLADGAINGKKRKREDFEHSSNEYGNLSIDEVRRIQATHKIKITDLKTLHRKDRLDDRKGSKEASRIFPQPLLRFSALEDANVNHSLLENVTGQGYKNPTEVQIATIPLLTSKADQEPNLLTIAPTGSGKTLAFLIPLINKISEQHKDSGSDPVQRHVSAIILAPTKELVNQIVNEGRKLVVKTGVQITAFKKGMRLHEEVDTVDDQSSEGSSEAERSNQTPIVKADIIVSTPLTLLHSLTPKSSTSPLSLPQATNLILDEADVLLDPLFRDQTLAVWSSCTNKSLRTSFWSATIGSNIEELVLSTIKEREKSKKSRKQQIPLLRCVIGLKDSSLPNIEHKLVYAATESGKLTGIRQILRPPPSTTTEPLLRPPFLVFTQTIPRAQSLHSELLYDIPPSATTETPRIAVLHSSLSSTQRAKVMQNFRLGKVWVLITTDLLSRGVDFRGVNGVVNYDIPTTSASYVHRAGRTGRAGREGGVCITLYTREDIMYLRPLVNLINKAQKSHRDGMNRVGRDEDGQVSSAPAEMVPAWLLNSLPHLSKEKRKDLKMRGVEVRRGAKESDVKSERRSKNRNMIGTKSGYDKKLEDRRRGMVEGSKRRSSRSKHSVSDDEDVADDLDMEFSGFD